jgi:hypothetical protein
VSDGHALLCALSIVLVYRGARMALASSLVRRPRGVVTLLTCGVLATLPPAYARAQAAGVPTSSITAPASTASGASPEPPPSSAAPTAAPTEPADPGEPDADASIEAPAPISASAGGRAELERRLHELEQERAHWTNLWPWVTVGTGATAVLLGTVVGAAAAFDCEPDTTCAAAPWATLIVVVGAAIGTVGAIWLVRTDAGIRELEVQTQRVRADLEQLEHGRVRRNRGFAALDSPPLRLRMSF